ncbi:AAA family ATPase [Geobacter sp. DSM 9736]|uniref:AAA family ATPase n=1 Tax=Geobacter sp. DSM 9736 TaxID=1277350 RepID=UPI000B50076B|nr:AAA family ATPase [Geobacter sp. DSM 9736]SNB47865.1 AAA domain (dynein-related subfamily) [Geobacter sp. DSM 9736]
MNVEQMKTVVREILVKTDLTPCIVGHRGVGKTAGIIQVCRELGRRYVPLRLGQMEVGDLVGIPYREGEAMHWSRPSWMPRSEDQPTIVHCDELNRAQQEDTLQAIFQFVEPPAEGERRALHTHKLDPKHKVIVTINPPDGSYQVTPLDRALIDRMVMLYVETDYHCWAAYAQRRDLEAGVRQFLAGNTSMLAKAGIPMEIEAEPTERGWEMVSTLRKECRFPRELEMEVYAGIVGKTAAVAFLRWCAEQRHRPVTAAEVLDNWPEVADRLAAQRDDAQAATMNDIITTLKNDPQLNVTREENLVRYVDILPRDMRFGMVKALLRIPPVAQALSRDKYDGVILDAIRQISAEA